MTSYRRVTVTVPVDVLREADRLARGLARSRSWVVTEALRRFAALSGRAPGTRAAPAGVHAEVTPPYAARPGLDEQRLAQLESDMKLTPEQRVREAQSTVELAYRLHRPPRAAQVLSFETYEDFLDWRERDLLW